MKEPAPPTLWITSSGSLPHPIGQDLPSQPKNLPPQASKRGSVTGQRSSVLGFGESFHSSHTHISPWVMAEMGQPIGKEASHLPRQPCPYLPAQDSR